MCFPTCSHIYSTQQSFQATAVAVSFHERLAASLWFGEPHVDSSGVLRHAIVLIVHLAAIFLFSGRFFCGIFRCASSVGVAGSLYVFLSVFLAGRTAKKLHFQTMWNKRLHAQDGRDTRLVYSLPVLTVILLLVRLYYNGPNTLQYVTLPFNSEHL